MDQNREARVGLSDDNQVLSLFLEVWFLTCTVIICEHFAYERDWFEVSSFLAEIQNSQEHHPLLKKKFIHLEQPR